ncbi:hypothetical protein TWF481_002577 [Arthrobotrys musiformis]|uniref:C2H2-type domain-containing protein n=1 Tax=Arthrobotrys musiformis TaxID=47236 RepID=A0AAV9VSB4_9PEZI
MVSWDPGSIDDLVDVNNHLYEHFENQSSLPIGVSSIDESDESDLCKEDLPFLIKLAGAAEYIAPEVHPKSLLIWTRRYLGICCYLSDPQLQYDANSGFYEIESPTTSTLPEQTTPAPSVIPDRRLVHHAYQFLRSTDSLSWHCVLCSSQVSCRYFLHEHWKKEHSDDPHFFYFWPRQCNVCGEYMPCAFEATPQCQICFGINGLGKTYSILYDYYRWLFYQCLFHGAMLSGTMVHRISERLNPLLDQHNAQTIIDASDIFSIFNLYERIKHFDTTPRRCENLEACKRVHDALAAHIADKSERQKFSEKSLS